MTDTSPRLDSASVPDASVAPPRDSSNDARDRLVIRLLLVSAFVVILNETIMGVALPRLAEDLEVSIASAQWLTTVFMLTMAVVIPITGFLLQRFNTRPVFMAAMTLFSAGTLIAAIAPGFEVLLGARIVQATGTAIMMPLLMTTVMTLVPPASRGRTMGNISIVISVAPAIGPTISGAILSVLDWRWMFILVLPIAVGALVLGINRVQNVTTPRAARFDVLSVILSAFGFGGFVYGLSSFGAIAAGGSLYVALIASIVGIVALIAFVWRQRMLQRDDRALLDLRTFESRTFTFTIVMFSISMLAFFGTIVVLPIYMQNVLELDSLTTGLLLLPGGLTMGLLAPIVGRTYDRIGPTALLVTGAVITSSVLWILTTIDERTSMWMVLGAHVALSVGLALLFTPLFSAGLGALRPRLYSHGSAIVGTVQQLAGGIGTALFVTVMATVQATAAASGSGDLAAEAAGVRAAFLIGAIISVLAIPAAFMIRRNPEAEGAELPSGGH